ncbi:MAG TPA: DUF393 domain-containing protein [Tepidisphaeraceae bacterium]
MAISHLTIIYDGQCEVCQWSRRMLERFDGKKKLVFVDLHDSAAMAAFPQVQANEAMQHMIAISPDGRIERGYDGFVLILENWRFTGLLRWIMQWRISRWAGGKIYGMIARNRYRIRWLPTCGTSCSIKH